MKLLYISSFHPALEYDDLTIFSDLGIDWFSTGVYLNPQQPHKVNMRCPFNKEPNIDLINEWQALNPQTWFIPRTHNVNFTKHFIDKFDVIFISNFAFYLNHWDVFKHKPVIYRTYDGHDPTNEKNISLLKNEGLKIVRLFEFETRIPFITKEDAVIGNFVDSNIYKNWNGLEECVLSFNNDFASRVKILLSNNTLMFQGYPLYYEIQKQFKCKYYGFDHTPNCSTNFSLGGIEWEAQKNEYRNNRVYFSLGSKPGPYTYNFLEALMTGIPTISFGHKLGDYNHPWYMGSYEVPEIIENGVNGFYSDNIEELKEYIHILLENFEFAKIISENSRKLAIKKFDKPQIIEKWKNFLEKL